MSSAGIDRRWIGVGIRKPCSVKERSSQGCKPTVVQSFISSFSTAVQARLTHALETTTTYFTFRHLALSLRLLQHVCPSFDVTFGDRLSYQLLKFFILVFIVFEMRHVLLTSSRLGRLTTDQG